MSKQPQVGNLVQLRIGDCKAGAQHHVAAVVTRVWSPSCVNLQVFRDTHDCGIEQLKAAGVAADRVSSAPLGEGVGSWRFIPEPKPEEAADVAAGSE